MIRSIVPVPLSGTVCGLSAALSVKLRVPLRVPVAVGVKVTFTVQLAAAARTAWQSFVWAKSPLLAMLTMASGALPLLVRVTGFGALFAPSVCGEKLRLVGFRLATGAGI